MSQRRFALLIGGSEFSCANGQLAPLPSAVTDVRSLEKALSDPDVGDFTHVQVSLDLPHWEILMRINQALRDAGRDDQVLIYYSGHGLLNAEGDLFLATVNTNPSLLASTALPVSAVRSLLSETQCRRIVIILDCCYSAAVERLKIDQMVNAGFEDVASGTAGGYAICIIAASAASDRAYAPANGGESVLTAAILEAIRTCEGDKNNDGVIDLQELYDYACDKHSAHGFPKPQFFSAGAIGCLTLARTAREFAGSETVERIRSAISHARQTQVDWPEEIFERAEQILQQSEKEIRQHYEALFSLLRDWSNERISLSDLSDQWYQFDQTGLVATDKTSEVTELADQWSLVRECRLPIHDLVCPSYILDRNYHFLDWNPMFDELVAKPMGLTRFRHAEDFILKLKNHREIIERSRQLFSDDIFPMVHMEDLEYESPKYGLIVFKKIAAQISSEKGGLLAWSVNLNVTHAERAEEMWADLEKRLASDVNWAIYAKLYDRMLLQFDPYKELVAKAVYLLGDAQVVGDLGAGTGNVTVELLEHRYRQVWALESNEEMLEQLRRKLLKARNALLKRVKVFKGDLMVSLREFEQDFLDGAVMVNTLYAIPDRARCLGEVYRVLKPGGVFVYSTSTSETDVDRLFGAIERELTKKRMIKTLRPVVDLAYDRHRAMAADILRDSPSAVIDYARQAGFEVDDADILPNEYEGAVTIVRATKPTYLRPQPTRGKSLPSRETKSAESDDVLAPSFHNSPAHVFISYAREDKAWCEQIKRYLQPAEDSGKIKIWADTEIQPGERWEQAICENLNRSALAVLLVTPYFLTSKYVREKEMPWLLEKMRLNELAIIPVMIDKALVETAHYRYPDADQGPHGITLSELQIEMYEDQPVSHLDKPKQNLFVDKLAQTILARIAN
ncbi:MAG: TIR domain-containing protein [Gammaproteobacteria bacterium]|nr:TIR domain-containing protein [Gammaproteobacteria bacterium]